MAEDQQNVKGEKFEGEVQDRGMLNFLGKKKEEEKAHGNVVGTEGVKVQESGKEGEEKKPGLMEKLHRTGSSSSSSSSDEEVDVNGEKKKKKTKGTLKEKLAEKMSGEKKPNEDTNIEVEKVDSTTDEKKGFVDKIKEKIPGHQKKPEVEKSSPVPPPALMAEEKDKDKEKGFLGKIMDKIPGYHKAEGGDQHQQGGATTTTH